ncbi:MAG: Acyl-homoserine lactone, partial [Rhodocyclales bacterium]|nr:Acyl-homoserine lactone [Rhodocyclales bacterium]
PSAQTGSAKSPSELLGGLKSWKLTLPTGPSDKATDILDLSNYSNSPWFTLNPTRTAVNFRTNAGGSRTTKNTAYSRTELREMTSDGSGLGAWACESAKRSMHIEQVLTHTAKNKPEASIGQIHDPVNDNLMLLYTGPANANGATDTGTLTAYFNNRASSVVLDSAYKLGDKMVIDVTVADGAVGVKYQNLRSSRVLDSGPVAFINVKGACYFKAGMYIASCSKTDSNGGANQVCVNKGWTANLYDEPDDYAELAISKLSLK